MFLRLKKGPSAKGARQTQLTGTARFIAIQRCTKHCFPVSITATRLVLVRGKFMKKGVKLGKIGSKGVFRGEKLKRSPADAAYRDRLVHCYSEMY